MRSPSDPLATYREGTISSASLPADVSTGTAGHPCPCSYPCPQKQRVPRTRVHRQRCNLIITADEEYDDDSYYPSDHSDSETDGDDSTDPDPAPTEDEVDQILIEGVDEDVNPKEGTECLSMMKIIMRQVETTFYHLS